MEPGTQDRDPFARKSGGESTEQLKEKASELTHTARQRAFSALEQQKSQLCGLLDRVADSVQDDPLGEYASEYARRGAQFLRSRPSDELARSFQRELRARPGLALSAAFVVGLAFARLVKGAGGDGMGEPGTRARWASGDGEWRERGYGELRGDYEAWRHGEDDR
jgi:hypothetical protein